MWIIDAGFRILVGLSPVFAFLVALMLLDSFKLVKLRTVAGLIVAGGLAAGKVLPADAEADFERLVEAAHTRGMRVIADLEERVLGERLTRLAEEMLTEGDGQIRGLVTSAGNPVLSTPNGAQLERAIDVLMQRLD